MTNISIENNQFRIYAAQEFLQGLLSSTPPNNLYVWIGQIIPWSNESSPPQPNDTVAARIADWFAMMAIKRVAPSDVTLVIPRYNWTASTVYTQYSDLGQEESGIYYDLYEPTLGISPFFVFTTDNNVYKCLNNNNGSTSSIMPTGTSTAPITLADGYIWKFMFQIDAEDMNQFASPNWIPIHTLTFNDGSAQWAVQTTAINGAIYTIEVTDNGTGYSVAPTVTVTGNGTGCTATAVLTGTAVTSIIVNTPGKNYTMATVSFSGVGGATAHAIISPPGGHGSNPVYELGAMYVMVNILFNYDESNKITVNNSYRQFGLLLNPLAYNSVNYYYPSVGTATTNITLTSVTGTFSPNDMVVGSISGATAYVVDFGGVGSNIARLIQVEGTFQIGENLNDITSSAVGVISIITPPDIQRNTGLILTTENVSPEMRAVAQIENIKITIPF